MADTLTLELFNALNAGNLQRSTILLEKRADPNYVLRVEGASPMHIAAGLGEAVTILLLSYGGDPNVRSADGSTPLHVAACWGDIDCLQLLLCNGGDPLAKDQEGQSVLDSARNYGHFDCARLLEYHCQLLMPVEEDFSHTPKFTYQCHMISKFFDLSQRLEQVEKREIHPGVITQKISKKIKLFITNIGDDHSVENDPVHDSLQSYLFDTLDLEECLDIAFNGSQQSVDAEKNIIYCLDVTSPGHPYFDLKDSLKKELQSGDMRLTNMHHPPSENTEQFVSSHDTTLPWKAVKRTSSDSNTSADTFLTCCSSIDEEKRLCDDSALGSESMTSSLSPTSEGHKQDTNTLEVYDLIRQWDEELAMNNKDYDTTTDGRHKKNKTSCTPVTRDNWLTPVTRDNCLSPVTRDNCLSPETCNNCRTSVTRDNCLSPVTRDNCLTPVTRDNCRTPVTRDNCLTPVTRDKCLTQVTRDKCLTQVTRDKCLTQVTCDNCRTPVTRDNCRTPVTRDNCLTPVTRDKCLTQVTCDNCLTPVTRDNCLSPETCNNCRTPVANDDCRTSNCVTDRITNWLAEALPHKLPISIDKAVNSDKFTQCQPQLTIGVKLTDETNDVKQVGQVTDTQTEFPSFSEISCSELDQSKTNCFVHKSGHNKFVKRESIESAYSYSDTSTVEYVYTDPEKGIQLLEKHIPSVCGSTGSSRRSISSLNSSTISQSTILYDVDFYTNNKHHSPDNNNIPKNMEKLSNNEIRERLKTLGKDPGPVTSTTRKTYLRNLVTMEKIGPSTFMSKTEFLPELSLALSGHIVFDEMPELENKMTTSFGNPRKGLRWREGTAKSSFTYLLLDPRVTKNLPNRALNLGDLEIFTTFIEAIFYIGKGKRARPYAHLYEAIKYLDTLNKKQPSCKLVKILEIWQAGLGVVSLHCFQSVIPVEAYTREACMVDAMGLQKLTNQKKGDYYGISTTWNGKQRRKMGVYLLKKALQIFLAEGERQICPMDMKSGQ